MAVPSTLDYVTLGIAAVGALTGVAALGATWAQFMLSGPRLKVAAGTAMPTDSRAFLYYVSVENVGRMPVIVQGLGLQLPKDAQVPLVLELTRGRGLGPQLPHRMEPSGSESWYFPVEPILNTFRAERFPTKGAGLRAGGFATHVHEAEDRPGADRQPEQGLAARSSALRDVDAHAACAWRRAESPVPAVRL